MRMMRRIVPIVLVLLVVVAGVIVLTSRPGLEDARKDVDTTWDAAAPKINQRLVLLAAADQPLVSTPGPVGDIAKEVDAELKTWVRTQQSNDRDAAIESANALEGLGRRLVAVVRASPRVSADPNVTAKVDAFANTPEPAELAAFARAVRAYEDERRGPIRGLVAGALGYDQVPTLSVPASA
jgi:hypothetical protein